MQADHIESVQVGWSAATYDSVNPVTKEVEFENESPLFAQAAIIWDLNNRRTFLVRNEVGELYPSFLWSLSVSREGVFFGEE
ncbi:MAG: hypothetical protein SVR04_06385 [Spirochaetota bacterium]|nr:hypothetical protein [Spirochaetota bacterium]